LKALDFNSAQSAPYKKHQRKDQIRLNITNAATKNTPAGNAALNKGGM
jgi:hypothetical protein